MPTPEELCRDVVPAALAGLAGEERSHGEALLLQLCRDWLAEAAGSKLPDDVLRILRQDLERDLGGLGPQERLAVLEAEVLDRELRALSRESYALGQEIIDHRIADAAARQRGERILAATQALAARVQAISSPARRGPLRHQLEEVMLEGLYAVEHKAMSSRLAQYARDRQGSAVMPGPPKVSP
jgi:2-oxoglutarate dehydrogenase complex dehydrogenase (E1) component-like enzyme